MVSVATALAAASLGVMLTVVADAPAGSAGGKPRSQGEVTAVCVAVALTLFSGVGTADD